MADLVSWMTGARYKKLYDFVSKMNELKADDPDLTPSQRLNILVTRAKTTKEKEELKAIFQMLKATGMENCKKEDIKAQMQAQLPNAQKDFEEKEQVKDDAKKELSTAKKQLSDCRKQLWLGRFMRLGIVALATFALASVFVAAPVILGAACSAIGGAASFGASIAAGLAIGVGGYYLVKIGTAIVSKIFKHASGLINEANAEMSARKKRVKEAKKNGAEAQAEYEDAKAAYESLEQDLNEMSVTEEDKTNAKLSFNSFENDLANDSQKVAFSSLKARYQEMVQDAQTIGEINKAKAWLSRKTNNMPTKTELEAIEKIYKANEEAIKKLNITDSNNANYLGYGNNERSEAIRALTAQQQKIEVLFSKKKNDKIDFADISKYSRDQAVDISGVQNVISTDPAKRNAAAKSESKKTYGHVATEKDFEAYIELKAAEIFPGKTDEFKLALKEAYKEPKRGLIVVKRDEDGKISACEVVDEYLLKQTKNTPSREAVANYVVENKSKKQPVVCSAATKNVITTDLAAIKSVGLNTKSKKATIDSAELNDETEKLLFENIANQSSDTRFVLEAELRSHNVCDSNKNKQEYEDIIAKAVKDVSGKALDSNEYSRIMNKAKDRLAKVSRHVSDKERKQFQKALSGEGINYRGLFEDGKAKDGLSKEQKYLASVMLAAALNASSNGAATQAIKNVTSQANGITKPAEPRVEKIEDLIKEKKVEKKAEDKTKATEQAQKQNEQAPSAQEGKVQEEKAESKEQPKATAQQEKAKEEQPQAEANQ